MKKTKGILIIVLIFILLYFFQINFFSWFTIRGVKPNLFVILSLFIGLFAGKKIGGILGAIFGFVIDILGNNIIRTNSFNFRYNWIFAEDI